MTSNLKFSGEYTKENLSRLTVVIPTFQRQKYLKRICLYWQNTGVKLVIVDGSEKSFEKELKETLIKYSNIHKIQ